MAAGPNTELAWLFECDLLQCTRGDHVQVGFAFGAGKTSYPSPLGDFFFVRPCVKVDVIQWRLECIFGCVSSGVGNVVTCVGHVS